MTNSASVFIDHYTAQLWGVDSQLLNNRSRLLKTSLRAAADLDLTIVKSFVHKFEPFGLSLILVIAESHLAIHTWPELGYMNVDVLSCSHNSHLEKIQEVLKAKFKPSRIQTKKISY